MQQKRKTTTQCFNPYVIPLVLDHGEQHLEGGKMQLYLIFSQQLF